MNPINYVQHYGIYETSTRLPVNNGHHVLKHIVNYSSMLFQIELIILQPWVRKGNKGRSLDQMG